MAADAMCLSGWIIFLCGHNIYIVVRCELATAHGPHYIPQGCPNYTHFAPQENIQCGRLQFYCAETQDGSLVEVISVNLTRLSKMLYEFVFQIDLVGEMLQAWVNWAIEHDIPLEHLVAYDSHVILLNSHVALKKKKTILEKSIEACKDVIQHASLNRHRLAPDAPGQLPRDISAFDFDNSLFTADMLKPLLPFLSSQQKFPVPQPTDVQVFAQHQQTLDNDPQAPQQQAASNGPSSTQQQEVINVDDTNQEQAASNSASAAQQPLQSPASITIASAPEQSPIASNDVASTNNQADTASEQSAPTSRPATRARRSRRQRGANRSSQDLHPSASLDIVATLMPQIPQFEQGDYERMRDFTFAVLTTAEAEERAARMASQSGTAPPANAQRSRAVAPRSGLRAPANGDSISETTSSRQASTTPAVATTAVNPNPPTANASSLGSTPTVAPTATNLRRSARNRGKVTNYTEAPHDPESGQEPPPDKSDAAFDPSDKSDTSSSPLKPTRSGRERGGRASLAASAGRLGNTISNYGQGLENGARSTADAPTQTYLPQPTPCAPVSQDMSAVPQRNEQLMQEAFARNSITQQAAAGAQFSLTAGPNAMAFSNTPTQDLSTMSFGQANYAHSQPVSPYSMGPQGVFQTYGNMSLMGPPNGRPQRRRDQSQAFAPQTTQGNGDFFDMPSMMEPHTAVPPGLQQSDMRRATNTTGFNHNPFTGQPNGMSPTMGAPTANAPPSFPQGTRGRSRALEFDYNSSAGQPNDMPSMMETPTANPPNFQQGSIGRATNTSNYDSYDPPAVQPNGMMDSTNVNLHNFQQDTGYNWGADLSLENFDDYLYTFSDGQVFAHAGREALARSTSSSNPAPTTSGNGPYDSNFTVAHDPQATNNHDSEPKKHSMSPSGSPSTAQKRRRLSSSGALDAPALESAELSQNYTQGTSDHEYDIDLESFNNASGILAQQNQQQTPLDSSNVDGSADDDVLNSTQSQEVTSTVPPSFPSTGLQNPGPGSNSPPSSVYPGGSMDDDDNLMDLPLFGYPELPN
ncbi:hypothetical protein Q7P37_000123 [Cladosporium fusiforme]